MVRRLLAASVLLGAVILSGAGSVFGAPSAGHAAIRLAAHAQANKTYTDAAGASFQYPSTWAVQKGAKSSDAFGKYGPQMAATGTLLLAPDQGSVMGVLEHRSVTSSSAIKTLSKNFLYDGVKALGPLTYAVKSINGVDFQLSELVAKNNGSGDQADELVIASSHGARTYYFVAAVLMSKGGKTVSQSVYNARIKVLQKILNSVVLK